MRHHSVLPRLTILLLTASVLAACSAGGDPITAPLESGSAAPSASTSSPAPSQSTSPTPSKSVAGTPAESFCDTVDQLTSGNIGTVTSAADAAARMRRLAADLRATAPPAIANAAADYATVFDTVADGIDGQVVDPSQAQQNLAAALADTNGQSIAAVAAYVALNCR